MSDAEMTPRFFFKLGELLGVIHKAFELAEAKMTIPHAYVYQMKEISEEVMDEFYGLNPKKPRRSEINL